jgi:acetoin utilization deacetylase AcuC-like enzyme
VLIVAGPVGEDVHEREGHPERPARIGAVLEGIADLHLSTDLLWVPVHPATDADLARVHTPGHLDLLDAFCRTGGGNIDPDTYAGPESYEAARRAAGAGLAAVEALERNGEGVAFVVARPPGHHAVADTPMGFCLLNNVAVAAAALADRGERVLVLDWDVHHGNGTQAIFWDDPRVLYVSTHQERIFPGTGAPEEVGGDGAVGLTVNVGLPARATGDVVRRAIDDVALPVIDAFEPTWVLVSAGFDAHRADPLADLALSSGDFAALARAAGEMAPRPGRVVLFLEGGYDLGALQSSVGAALGALVGAGEPAEGPTSGGPGREAVERAARARHLALDGGVRPT